ncbi:MAG: HTH domain-containing protein [Kofleriaceae bacterium]|nr:HTH domain-containing protein [Kofleriaceae bacterium]
MGKQGPLARLIALVHALTTSRRGIVVRQYAERTGVAVRTIYRDLGRLEDAGFPLGSEDGRYFLPASFTRLRTPGLEPDEELLALYLARQTARVLRGTSAGAARRPAVGQADQRPVRSGEPRAARREPAHRRRRRRSTTGLTCGPSPRSRTRSRAAAWSRARYRSPRAAGSERARARAR